MNLLQVGVTHPCVCTPTPALTHTNAGTPSGLARTRRAELHAAELCLTPRALAAPTRRPRMPATKQQARGGHQWHVESRKHSGRATKLRRQGRYQSRLLAELPRREHRLLSHGLRRLRGLEHALSGHRLRGLPVRGIQRCIQRLLLLPNVSSRPRHTLLGLW